jgi:hypothetical protein
MHVSDTHAATALRVQPTEMSLSKSLTYMLGCRGAPQGSESALYLEPESQSRAHTDEECAGELQGEECADGGAELDVSWDGEDDDPDDHDDTEGENVRVLVRVRPFSEEERVLRTQACTTVGPRTVRLPGRNQSNPYTFQFDHVFDTDADQHSLYQGACAESSTQAPQTSRRQAPAQATQTQPRSITLPSSSLVSAERAHTLAVSVRR